MNPPYAPGIPGVPLPPRVSPRNPGVTSGPDLPSRGSESQLETAVAIEAALAADRADRAEREASELSDDLENLEARVQILEAATKSAGERTHRRTAVVVAIISAIGSLIVSLVVWAINFAATTKADSVKQARQATQRDIAAAKSSELEQYERGARDGAEQALARQRRELADQDLVVVPRSLLVKPTASKR